MEQLGFKYFWPLTEQPELDLDYTPCTKYEEDKRKESLYNGYRLDHWGVTGSCLTSNGVTPVWTTSVVNDPTLIIYPDKTPITFKTHKKPSILARMIYRALGAKWEKV